jgi:hypothetical protein
MCLVADVLDRRQKGLPSYREMLSGAADRNVAAHQRIAKLHTVAVAAHRCGTDEDNPDTCGVCHLHFTACETDRFCDPTDDYVCPGARVRAALRAIET